MSKEKIGRIFESIIKIIAIILIVSLYLLYSYYLGLVLYLGRDDLFQADIVSLVLGLFAGMFLYASLISREGKKKKR
jgi:hypothetical protein